MKNKKNLLVILLALTLVALPLWAACAPEEEAPPPPPAEEEEAPPPPPPPEPIEWIGDSALGEETRLGEGFAWVVDRINERSEGRLVITPFYGGALGYKSPEYLNVFKDGLIDIAVMPGPATMGLEPCFAATCLSFGYFSYEDYLEKWCEPVLAPYLQNIVQEKWNTIFIGTMMEPRTAFFADRPIKTLDDIKGMDIRVVGGLDPKIYEKLGASPIYIPLEDLYTALQQGVVRAMPNSFSYAYEFKIWEVCDHVTIMGYVIGNSFLAVNKQAFEALPKDLQDIVLQAGEEYSDYMMDSIRANEQVWLDGFLEHGMTMTEMPEALRDTFQATAKEVWHEWAEGVGPEAIELLKLGGMW